MSEHRKFSPSGMSRILKCPASLEGDYPDESSVYAREGTAAHELAQVCFALDCSPADFVGREIDGFQVTEEMADAVQVYLDTIAAAKKDLEELTGVEPDVSIEVYIQESPLFGGTIDCLIEADYQIAIVDFKYGAGVVVEVEQNPQLLSYAILAASHRIHEQGTKTEGATLYVVQPRATHAEGPVRIWEPTMSELSQFRQSVEAAIQSYQEGGPKSFCAGDHCRWCPRKVDCPELYQLTVETARAEFKTDEMTPERAAEILGLAPALTGYLGAVENWVHGQLDKGIPVPGFKLVATWSNRKYKVDESVVLKECRKVKLGKKDIYDSVLKSPAKLEKIAGKPLVNRLVERVETGTTVVPESDKRPAVDRKTAAEEFAGIEPASEDLL